jgi:hypothetical protein
MRVASAQDVLQRNLASGRKALAVNRLRETQSYSLREIFGKTGPAWKHFDCPLTRDSVALFGVRLSASLYTGEAFLVHCHGFAAAIA